MIEVLVSAGTILLWFCGLWRYAARHQFWDYLDHEVPKARVSVPGLIDYTVEPNQGGIV